MPPPHNSHDNLVKRIFSNPEAAQAQLRLVLPAALVARLDWSSLALQSGSFVDAALRHRTSDLLYTVDLHGDGPAVAVYVLLEHQSTLDPKMAVRFLVYVGRVYEQFLREHPGTKSVPLVVPVLLFQGKDGWTAPRCLSDCIELPDELRGELPVPVELRFDVDDLSRPIAEQLNEVQLRRDRGLALAEMARTLLWLHRHPEASAGQRAAFLAPLLDAIAETWGVRAIEPFFVYLLSTFEPDTPIRAIMLNAANKETRQMYVTIREQLIAQGHKAGVAEGIEAGRAQGIEAGRAQGIEAGRAQGIEAGRAQGRAATLLQLLNARGLELSESQRDAIERCRSVPLLERWFERAITASSVAEVLED